jgi:hypothetical protein
MLRWTCRLRDVLQCLCVEESVRKRTKLSFLREAEFLTPQDQQELDWESFYQLFNGVERAVTLRYPRDAGMYHVPLFEPDCEIGRSVRLLSGHPVCSFHDAKVDVLWLTPTAFISSVHFSLFLDEEENTTYHAYEVTVKPRGNPSRTVYFSAGEFSECESFSKFPMPCTQPSPLIPLEFLHRMTASLPVDYFSSLSLFRCWDRFPLDYFHGFVACLPGASQGRSREALRTRLEFHDRISNLELQAILSHESLRDAQLVLDDVQPPLNEVNDTLQSFPHLCSFVAPTKLVEYDSPGESFAANENLKFLELSPIVEMDKLSSKLLDAISSNSSIQELKISFRIWTFMDDLDQISVKLRYLFERVLQRRCSLKKVTVCFCYDSFDFGFGDPYEKAIEKCMSIGLSTFGNFTSLCFLNFEHDKSTFDDLLSDDGDPDEGYFVDADEPVSRPNSISIKNFVRLQWWDEKIAPSLVLNFYREYMPMKIIAPLTPLAIHAVNLGVVYGKTSHHVPLNAHIASVGLIFHVFRMGSAFGDE